MRNNEHLINSKSANHDITTTIMNVKNNPSNLRNLYCLQYDVEKE